MQTQVTAFYFGILGMCFSLMTLTLAFRFRQTIKVGIWEIAFSFLSSAMNFAIQPATLLSQIAAWCFIVSGLFYAGQVAIMAYLQSSWYRG